MTERHDAALGAATAEHRAAAVGPSALPRLGTRVLDTVRVLSAAELERLLAQQSELDAAVGTAVQRAADAHTVHAAATGRIDEATARGSARAAEAAEAVERMVVVETRLIGCAEEQARSEQRLDALVRLRVGIDEVCSTSASAATSTAATLEALAALAGGEGIDEVATTLRTWSGQLCDGTAAVQPDAAALLAELAHLEHEWEAHGCGDLLADPAVRALQTTLDEARTVRDDIEAQASEGVLGARAMTSIRAANARRTELEALGNKADVESLRAAVAAETEALQAVGFDSMLDLHIAMSTGGAGTLVDASRATAAQRVSDLEAELALLLASTVALQGQLGDRFDVLRTRTDSLVGGLGDRSVHEALCTLVAVPEEVVRARGTLDVLWTSTTTALHALRQEEHELTAEAAALDLRHAVALEGVRSSTDELARAERTRSEAQHEADVAEQAASHLQARSADLATEVSAATRTVDDLAACRYLAADRCELSAALIATLFAHSAWLAGQATAADGGGPTAMVVDDPLDELEDPDALEVLDELIAVPWPTPVVYVTSRPKLVQRLRRDAGALRGVDARRRSGARGGWRRRRASDPALPH